MAFAALTIDLNAKLASFEQSLNRSVQIAQSNAARLEQAFAGVGNTLRVLGGLAGVIGVGAIVALGKAIVGRAADLDDLSEKTGATVEELSKLEQVARIGGTSMEVVEGTLIKLTKALSGADDESKNAGKALAALGLKAEELRNLDTAEALRRIAVELNKYADTGQKSALIQALLNKSAAEALPFLKDLAEIGGINARVTGEQAAKAEEFQKKLATLGEAIRGAAQELTLNFVPGILRTIEQMTEGTRIAGGFLNAILLFGTTNPFKNAGESIKGLKEELEGLKEKTASIGNRSGTEAIDQQRIEAIKKQIEFLKLVQRQQALSSLDEFSGRLDARDPRPVEKPELKFEPPKLLKVKKPFDFVGEVFKAAKTDLDKFVADYNAKLASLVSDTDVAKIEEIHKQITFLNAAFLAGDIADEKVYLQAANNLQKLLDATKPANKDLERLNELLGQTETAEIEKAYKDLVLLTNALNDGSLSAERFGEAINARFNLDKLSEPAKDAVDQFASLKQAIEGFGRDASRTLAEFIFTGKAGFKDFVQTAIRELAELILYRKVFEPIALGIGGFLSGGSGLSGFAGVAALARASLASGGPVTAGRGYLVGETGPEFFRPASSGTIVPNNQLGGQTNNVSVVVNVGANGERQSTINSQGSSAREFARGLEAAVLEVVAKQQRQGGMFAS